MIQGITKDIIVDITTNIISGEEADDVLYAFDDALTLIYAFDDALTSLRKVQDD